ncbi:unnamed protein product [Adineta steineri]|uniref:AIG1-type G domain-containing protein n=1 Tax=Adineta steineri TaxID=433720 RepID=A0A815N5B2_9BILA|nr:unnamed protein product [Adineta steineri]
MNKERILPHDLGSRRCNIKTKINEIFGELQRKYLEDDPGLESIQRNILLLGRAKSGKTTLKNILVDPRYQSVGISLCSSTVKQMTFDDSYNIGHLKLNIVNVPSKMIDETSDLNEINKICVEFGTVEYHLICFCVSINTGINEQDIELFKRLVEHFGNGKIRPNLCLVVTRSESKDEESRETILDELENDVHFNYVIKQLGRGVYFSGALNSQDWHRANEEPLLDQFRTIHEYRRSLLQSIMTNIDPFVMKIKTVAMVSESAESGLNKREIIQKDRDLENTSQSESIHNQENQDVWSQSTEGIDPRSVSSTSIFK